MPKPVYIICSESGSEDSFTGLASHYHVIEKIRITDLKNLPRQGDLTFVPALKFRATAVWMKEESDSPDQEFEFETAFYLPPDDSENVVQTGRFVFNPDQPYYRIVVMGQGPQPPAAGLFRVESRVRRIGSTDWIRQEYPILVEPGSASAELTGE